MTILRSRRVGACWHPQTRSHRRSEPPEEVTDEARKFGFRARDRSRRRRCAVGGRERAAAWRWGARRPTRAKTKMKNVDGKMLSIADVAGQGRHAGRLHLQPLPVREGLGAAHRRARQQLRGQGRSASCWSTPTIRTTHPEDGYEEMQTRAKSRGMKVPVRGRRDVGRWRSAFGAQRHARGVPVRQERQARLPRRHRRQPQASPTR